jgi:hypothetical protein
MRTDFPKYKDGIAAIVSWNYSASRRNLSRCCATVTSMKPYSFGKRRGGAQARKSLQSEDYVCDCVERARFAGRGISYQCFRGR